MIIAAIILVLIALIGAPLFVVLGAGGLLASYNSEIDPVGLIIELNRLASSPNLLAIPLFTLAGVTMAAGGAPQRLIRLFNAIFGWMPGGLAIVAIVSCAFFTAFSGASGVTILALGGLLYPMLVSAGYRDQFSLGLLTSSGSIGLLFPPSLAILLYGIVAGVSIDELFLAGIVPGLILLVLFSIYSYYSGVRIALPTQEFSWKILFYAIRNSAWDILLPIGVSVGITEIKVKPIKSGVNGVTAEITFENVRVDVVAQVIRPKGKSMMQRCLKLSEALDGLVVTKEYKDKHGKTETYKSMRHVAWKEAVEALRHVD